MTCPMNHQPEQGLAANPTIQSVSGLPATAKSWGLLQTVIAAIIAAGIAAAVAAAVAPDFFEAWGIAGAPALFAMFAGVAAAFLAVSASRRNSQLLGSLNLHQQRAAQREAHIVDALRILGDGIILYDKDDRLALCTDHARQFFSNQAHLFVEGRTYREILQAGLKEGLFPDAKGREAEWLDGRLRARQKCDGEIEFRLPDRRWVRITERRTTEGGIVTLCRNVTSRKEAEMALERAHGDIAGLAEAAAAGDFSVRVDLAGKSGMILKVGESLNSLVGTVRGALTDVISLMSRMAKGDLSKRM